MMADRPRVRAWPPRRVLLVDGTLVIPEVAAWLQRQGVEVEIFTGHRRAGALAVGQAYVLNFGALIAHIDRFQPDLLLQTNGRVDDLGILSRVCALIRLPWAVWWLDVPSSDENLSTFSAQLGPFHIPLVFDPSSLLDAARRLGPGFLPKRHLPLATEPRLFGAKLRPWAERDLAVCFVGSSLHRAEKHLRESLSNLGIDWPSDFDARLLALQAGFVRDRGSAWVRGQPAAEDADFRSQLCLVLQRLWPGVDLHSPLDPRGERGLAHESLSALVEYYLTYLWRRRWIEPFVDQGLVVFGDEGWRACLAEACQASGRPLETVVRGPLQYHSELPEIYGRTRVLLNASRTTVWGAYNQRVLDGFVAEAMVYSDPRPQIYAHFGASGAAAQIAEDLGQLESKIEVSLRAGPSGPRQRHELKGEVLKAHTYDVRMVEAWDIIREHLDLYADEQQVKTWLLAPEGRPALMLAMEHLKKVRSPASETSTFR